MNHLINRLVQWDKDLFLFINNMHLDVLDPVMIAFSSFISFFIVIGIIIFFMTKKEGRIGVITSVFFVITIGFNSLINNILKVIIARPRPLHEIVFKDVIHTLGGNEASFSFYSGHSSSAFCIALFSILYLKNKVYTILILSWTFIVAYSRIYLGRHYPLDVLCGILAGSLIGSLGYKLYAHFKEKKVAPLL